MRFHRDHLKPGPALLIMLAALLFVSIAWDQASAQDTTQIEEGARLYTENCAVCHGTNGEGRVGATLAKDWPSIRPDLQVENTIRNGIPGTAMPAWSDEKGGPLTDEQIEAITQFILSWQTGGIPVVVERPSPTARPPIEPVPGVEGDPNHGALLFSENCTVCHGPDGRGRVGSSLAKSFPSVRPDLQVKTTIANGISGSAMPAWSQANGGPLSEAEINDLTAFVVALPDTSEQGAALATPVPETGESLLQGPAGVILLVVLFVVLVGGMILYQRRTA